MSHELKVFAQRREIIYVSCGERKSIRVKRSDSMRSKSRPVIGAIGASGAELALRRDIVILESLEK